MITEVERDQIDALNEMEADFYAPLMFLCLYRLEQARDQATHEVTPTAIREVVTEAYKDLNAEFNTPGEDEEGT